jgi:ABC-type transport system involved in multi-copper enzyme maturation permease subunit
MKAIFNILTVSKYEAKTLFRSWFFRIFSALSIIFVFLYNLGTQTSLGFPNGDMVALPAMIPFTNLYIINVAQAIIAVFLASDFLKRDKKLDTTEVIYMRSMTNADYVIGKTLGNIWVFLFLNLVALGMVAVFNMASPYTQFSPMPYFYYFLIISLPTLIFILGFSFFLMSVIHNQAVTFVILLGYIAATLFYLQNIYFYLFDYMAFHLPLTYSDFVGFASLKDIMIHRCIYLFLGLGFIGLTIMILKRLPQSIIIRKTTLVSSIVLLLLGFGFAFIYINNINIKDKHRAQMLALNNKYAESPVIEINSCDLELEHNGNEIIAKAALEMANNNKAPVNEIILTLNPGLEITELSGAKFIRELQLLKITPDSPLQPGNTLKINIAYRGTIDESFCYLDMNRDRLGLLMNRGNGIADKKHFFLTPRYLLLTPETRWYPTAGISYSSNGLNWLVTQFTDYSLKVKTRNGLKAISQGKASIDGNGFYLFKPETKLTQISLAIGNYKTRSITVDNVDYSLTYLSEHNFFDKYFKILPDSIAPVIRDLRKTWEAKVQFVYPFKRLSLVEIPVQFCSFDHVWSGLSEQVQPETVYLPEGGFKLKSANFPLSQKFAERMGQRDNQTVSPREKEESYFKRFVNETLLSNKTNSFGGGNRGGGMGGGPGGGMGGGMSGGMSIQIGQSGPNFGTEEANPYFIFPNYYNYVTYIKSDKYPISNRVVESYLSKSATDAGNSFMRNITGTSSNEKGNIALQEQSFAQILGEQNDPEIVGSVIQTKSGFLFALMKGAVGTDKFDEFIHKFIESKQFREVPINELNDEMKNSFGLNLEQYLPVWYSAKTLPGYILSKLQAVKIKDEDKIKTMVSFILTNSEDAPGAITVTFRLGGGRGGGGTRGGGGGFGSFGGSDNSVEKTISIGAKQSKKVSYLLNRDPRTMTIETYASHNIPSTISQQFDKIEINEKLAGFEGEEIIPYTDGSEPSEIILDNEDPGFKVEQPVSQSLIKKLFFSSDNPEDNLKYKGMSFWNPPVDWTLITNDQFYGKQIRSAYYMKGGTGNCKAIWNVPLKEGGYYKLWAFIPKIRFGRGGDEKKNEEYNYTVFNDNGKDHQIVNLKNIDGGWVELGSYHFSSGTAKIELSNLSKARTVFADAVKLVKEN